MLCVIGSRARCRRRLAKLCRLQIKRNVIIYCVCVFICVCLGRPDEGGGSPNQTPYLNKNNQNGARDVEREKWQGDLTCESGNAYLHANYVARWGGREWKAPPKRQTERGRARKDTADARETRGTDDPTNGQTNDGIKRSL